MKLAKEALSKKDIWTHESGYHIMTLKDGASDNLLTKR